MPFKGISYLELFSGAPPFVQFFERVYYEEQFYEILNLGQWLRCHLKDFLSGALVALLFGGAEPFMQF